MRLRRCQAGSHTHSQRVPATTRGGRTAPDFVQPADVGGASGREPWQQRAFPLLDAGAVDKGALHDEYRGRPGQTGKMIFCRCRPQPCPARRRSARFGGLAPPPAPAHVYPGSCGHDVALARRPYSGFGASRCPFSSSDRQPVLSQITNTNCYTYPAVWEQLIGPEPKRVKWTDPVGQDKVGARWGDIIPENKHFPAVREQLIGPEPKERCRA